jgi:hypothetical protein
VRDCETISFRAAVLGAAALAAAACKGRPSCDEVIDHLATLRHDEHHEAMSAHEHEEALEECERYSADERRCLLRIADPDHAATCLGIDPSGELARREMLEGDGERGPRARKRDEAEMVTNVLVHSVEATRVRTGAFPPTPAGPTPPVGSCCKQPGGVCAPDPSLWTGPWRDLGVELLQPNHYSYAYEVDDPARHVVVRAIGDLDCDGVTSERTIDFSIDASGQVRSSTSSVREGE